MKKLSQAVVRERYAKSGMKLVGIYRRSDIPVQTRCLHCGHLWKIRYSTVQQGGGCPQCALARFRDTAKRRYQEHFKHRKLVMLEEYQGALIPILTKCGVCKHRWRIRPNDVANGRGCPSCKQKSLALSPTEFKRRFLAVGLVALEVGANQLERVRVRCQTCKHTYRTTGNTVSQGCGCPKCRIRVRIREDEVRKTIERLTGWSFPKAHPSWLLGRGTQPMELDGYNKDHAVAFEYQGEQHYKTIYGQKALAATKRNDNRKRCLARYHGVLLIRIPYWTKNAEQFIKTKLQQAGLM